MNIDKTINVLEAIKIDMKNDAKNFDGKLLTGRNVAEYFGYHGAAILILADILKEILMDLETKEIK